MGMVRTLIQMFAAVVYIGAVIFLGYAIAKLVTWYKERY